MLIAKKNILVVFALLIASFSFAQQSPKGFAIVIDQTTYTACKVEIDAYKKLLENEGFSATIYAQTWTDPVEIKNILQKGYKQSSLEGAVFIGDIPIPMIRDAQHLTSSFKLSQTNAPFIESSVPSDRYYDDFDLKFDYLGQKEAEGYNPEKYFYYSLRFDSPQFIKSDIYTGRIKPTEKGEKGFEQIRIYFQKLQKERAQQNSLDVVTSYTGEGSYSNSLTAWRDGGVMMREHLPQAFNHRNSAKFLFYSMQPFMKEMVINELRRPELDLMIFHAHGLPDRQYLTAIKDSEGYSANQIAAKGEFRKALRRMKTDEARNQAKAKWMTDYRIDSSWFAGALDRKLVVQDSLDDLKTGIILEDVPGIAPKVRMVIFDACYNGDFREDNFIAAAYIFSEGRNLVTFANSVNVLQDKSATDMLGLLGMGFNIGQWAQETNILESHIFGDPTFQFTSTAPSQIQSKSTDTKYWLQVYENEKHPDVKALALQRLAENGHPNMAAFLLKAYEESPFYSVRLQAFQMIQKYDGPYFVNLLKMSIDDPYEFIRRRSVYLMSRIGLDEFIPAIVSVCLNDYLDERFHFNSYMTFDQLDAELLRAEFKKQLAANTSFIDKDATYKKFNDKLTSRQSVATMADDILDPTKPLKSRLMATTMLRNNAYHHQLSDYLLVIRDQKEDPILRTTLAEALGWFTLSHKRGDIVKTFKEVAAQANTSEELKKELLKSVSRIEAQMRIN